MILMFPNIINRTVTYLDFFSMFRYVDSYVHCPFKNILPMWSVQNYTFFHSMIPVLHHELKKKFMIVLLRVQQSR